LEKDLEVKQNGEKLPKVIAYHQSVLVRRGSESEMRLQHNKIANLRGTGTCICETREQVF
jgi:hypothetical protein